jgi:hypothetical protein
MAENGGQQVPLPPLHELGLGPPPPLQQQPPLNPNANVFQGNGPVNNDGAEMLAAAAATVNLPPFWLERPVTWFNLCESTFATRHITNSVTKYHYCVGKIPADTIDSIEDLVNDMHSFNDPYEELKSRLTRAYGKTLQEKVDDLLDLPPLGSERPSVLMDRMLALWPDTTTKLTSPLLLGMFRRRLPAELRTQLATCHAKNPVELAAAADEIWRQFGGRFAAAAASISAALPHRSRSRSPSVVSTRPATGDGNGGGRDGGRNANRNGGGRDGRSATPGPKKGTAKWCSYHRRYGTDARNCRDGCTFPAKN